MLNIVQPQVQAWTGPKALRSVPNRSGRVLLRHRKDGRVGRRSRIGVGPLISRPAKGRLPLFALRLILYTLNPPLKNKTRRVIYSTNDNTRWYPRT